MCWGLKQQNVIVYLPHDLTPGFQNISGNSANINYKAWVNDTGKWESYFVKFEHGQQHLEDTVSKIMYFLCSGSSCPEVSFVGSKGNLNQASILSFRQAKWF